MRPSFNNSGSATSATSVPIKSFFVEKAELRSTLPILAIHSRRSRNDRKKVFPLKLGGQRRLTQTVADCRRLSNDLWEPGLSSVQLSIIITWRKVFNFVYGNLEFGRCTLKENIMLIQNMFPRICIENHMTIAIVLLCFNNL